MFNRYVVGPILIFVSGAIVFTAFLMAGFAALGIMVVVTAGILIWFFGELIKAQFEYRAKLKTRA